MLTSLQIKNFALIEDVCIDFTPGFNVFTGETGAGKSILIDAFGVVLGNRASLDYLRSDTDYYWVQAVFDLADQPNVLPILTDLDIPVEEETLFLRRKVMSNGKSQAFINDRQVPVSALMKLGSSLVDIHGQHENQALLKPETPLQLVDIYGGVAIQELLEQYHKIYFEHKAAAQALEQLQNQHNRQDEDRQLLEREIQEITTAHVVIGEDEQLRDKIQKLNNHGRILEGASGAHSILNGNEDKEGILDGLIMAKQALDKAAKYDDSLQALAETINSAWLTLDDVRQTLGSYLAADEFDSESLNRNQERLDMLFHLKQKYGGSLEAVLAYAAKAQEAYDNLANLEENIHKLEKKEAALLQELKLKAAALTAKRQEVGASFAGKITQHMQDLAMEQGKLLLQLHSTEQFMETGRDKVEFLFTANVGMEPKALNKIASGGELSRVALAMKTVLLEKYGAATMVFDEIDTGVGGVTAQKMAEKIAIISQCRQVICVTHLAQIASFADNHLHILKVVRDNKTFTQVEPLGQQERVEEIMRMTGGTNATKAAVENAQELLNMAMVMKKSLKGEVNS